MNTFICIKLVNLFVLEKAGGVLFFFCVCVFKFFLLVRSDNPQNPGK